MTWDAELAAIARAHLSADDAEAWISLLRPGIRLAHHSGGPAPVAARLGGNPHLPPDTAWPTWPGKGPLTFIADVDCGAVSEVGTLDIPLPADGTLLFFYFDGQVDENDTMVFYTDVSTQAGAAVLYVPADTPTAERPAPEGIEPYRVVELSASQIATEPGWEHRRSLQAFAEGGGIQDVLAHPVFTDEVFTTRAAQATAAADERHGVGGWADPVQGAIEYEIATAALGGGKQRSDALAAEEPAWVLLAQFDSDGTANMMWGDVGRLYWMIRPEDLAARRFDKALFTWQCC
jgi:uncharacterized protein YwqG